MNEAGKPEHTAGRDSHPIVAIGASAGGLEALTALLQALPSDTGMAFVIVQHGDPGHRSMMVELLGRATRMPIAEVKDTAPVEPDHVYLAVAGTELGIEDSTLRPTPMSEPHRQLRTIDHFLRSLAADQHHQAIAVILSGGGTDGTLGVEEIKAEGGITFAQDKSAAHDSMPRSAIASGCIDFVLAPKAIAAELIRIAKHPYLAAGELASAPLDELDLRPVIETLRAKLGTDFSHYKRNTLYRRITRRMLLHQTQRVEDYLNLLQERPGEMQALYQDILISVTSFFRNPEAFDFLKGKVFPALTRDRARDEPVRMWTLGCSTGEEAYSLAIAFAEYCSDIGRDIGLQLFATDLNGVSIEKARAGIYAKNIAQDVSPDRLRRFFTEVDGSYRVRKSIRDVCIFARHNVLTEPPFSRMDLITCRNLLIYLDSEVQQRVLPILHYSLQPQGYLWLGMSETIGPFRDLFEVEDARHKVYVKKAVVARMTFTGFNQKAAIEDQSPSAVRMREAAGATSADPMRESERVLLARYVPPSVLVNENLEILQYRGDTGLYLAPAPGRASLNLLKMLREGLIVAVRNALQRARRDGIPVRESNLRVKSNGGYRSVDVEIIPVRGKNPHELCFLVMFEESANLLKKVAPPPEPVAVEGESELLRVKQELAATRDYLQSVIEQQEAANEELQSANEEVQSANEELQSINEELETSKEEIQSSNEELATVNEELHNRNVELSQTNNDLLNLLSSVQMAIVMLGPDLRIRRFTPMAERMMNLIPADVGRPFKDLNVRLEVEDLGRLLEEVIDTVTTKEYTVRDRQGRWYSLRLRPYRTLDNKIDGVVIVLVDIDSIKRNDDTLKRQAELLEHTYEPIVMWALDSGVITYWNRAAEETYGYSHEQALGAVIHQLLATDVAPAVFRGALQNEGRWRGELRHRRRDQSHIEVESRMALVRDVDGNEVVIETNRPIGERKRMEQQLRDRADALARADHAKNTFLAMLGHELRNPLAPLRNVAEILRQRDIKDPELVRVREMLVRQVQAMARMVDDLVDVARVTSHSLELRREPTDLVPVLRNAVDTVRGDIDRRQQTLTVSLPPTPAWVDGDRVRLEQVVVNLLINASKFTSPKGRIALYARVGEGRATVSVEDNGTGIAPEMLPHVFGMFMQQSQEEGRNQDGLGIGLTLVKQLVELHGGSVTARSAGVGRGSEFTVSLPLVSPPASVASQTRPEPAATHARHRVLVVDDNEDAAASLSMLLQLDGHEVEQCSDGMQTLERLPAFKPDVVLLDIGLPGMDGYELAGRIRQAQDGKGVWLIALTGYGQDAHRRNAEQSGCDHFIVKPADYDTLRKLFDELPPRRPSA